VRMNADLGERDSLPMFNNLNFGDLILQIGIM
jgi:hypothetical protein